VGGGGGLGGGEGGGVRSNSIYQNVGVYAGT